MCGHCAAPLAPPTAPHEVRKTVTILFSDLKDSTTLGERLDPEAVREVLGRYFGEMRSIVERHGGMVEKFIGDAIMAVFGLPRLHEDDALRAVRAAVEMQQRLRVLNVELAERWGVELANRTAVTTGEVVADDSAASQRLVTGDPVNVAARLEVAARPMEVLIGEATYRLVRDAVDVEAIDPLAVKGKSEPVAAYRVVAVRGAEGFARHLDAPMIGREHELGLLVGAFGDAARRRAMRLATVVGDAGVGKSRLVNELTERLGDDVQFLHGRCLPYGDGITFWPLGEVVRQAAGIVDDDSPEQAYRRLSATLPDEPMAADRLAAVIGLTTESYELNDTFWAARRLFETLARSRPLVVHIEDIHWAEPTLLDLVEQICATAADAPALVVCSARHELLDGRPAWGDEVPDALRIDLRPLTRDEAGAIIDHLLGDADVAPALRRRIVDAAEGHPLYVEQFLSMLVDDGTLRRDDGQWVLDVDDAGRLTMPPTIAALLTARIDALDAQERGVLARGSVIGLTFYRAAVEELAPESMRDRVAPLLVQLSGKQLVEPFDESFVSDDTFRFHHALVRDASYASLLKRARAELHQRFARWLERVTLDRQLDVGEIIAYHLEQSHSYLSQLGPLDEAGQALGEEAGERLASAGRRAFARGDMPAAANLLARGVALLPAASRDRVELLSDLAEASVDLGELARAEELAEDAIGAARQLGDDVLLTDAGLVRLLVRYVTDSDGWSASVLQEAERAIPQLERAGAHRALAKAWRLLGSVHGTACRYADAERAVEQSIQHARLAGDRRQEIRNLPAYATAALYGPMPAPLAIQRCEEILDQAPGDLRAEGIVRCTLAQLNAMLGRFDQARVEYRRGREIFTQLGGRLLIASTSLDSGRVELLAGNPEEAISQLRPDHNALEEMGERYLRSTIAGLLGVAELEAGMLAEADAHARACELLAAPDDVEAQALWRSLRARLLAAAGDPHAGEPLARDAVELTLTTDGITMQAGALLDLARVLFAAGRGEEAGRTAAEAMALYRRKQHVVGEAAAAALL